MQIFNLILGKSAGNIVFGMSRSEARKLLGEYREFKNSQVEMNSLDQFAFCILGYDKENKVDFVSFNLFEDINLKLENRVISSMTALELLAYISKLDKTIEIETGGAGFESNALGIAAFFEQTPAIDESTKEEIVYDKLGAITVAVLGYWNKDKDIGKYKYNNGENNHKNY